MKNKIKIILIGVTLYFLASIASFFVFSNLVFSKTGFFGIESPIPPPKIGEGGRVVFDDNLPKTEECSLNGTLHSKKQKQWWREHRPLGIMIENHKESRPQSGLSYADVVYEIVSEGGITRFLGVFFCQDAGTVGPVRSVRTYFLDFISEYGNFPLFAHVGGANVPGPTDALGQIENYGWQAYNDLNQFSIGFPVFWRDYERLGHPVQTEHTVYSTTEKLWNVGKERGLTNVDKEGGEWDDSFTPYSFKDETDLDRKPQTQIVSFSFWRGYGDYEVRWEYDKNTNSYMRFNGNLPHLDFNTKKQLVAKNVAILSMQETQLGDAEKHLLYKTRGTGRAVVFRDGERIDGTWSKRDREAHTIIRNASGEEVKFNRGAIWFEILPTGSTIDVK